jgi:proteasome lid subunit RPN8/RPN11
VLTIDQATYDAIVAHARRDHPDEACGIVAGPEGSDRPERLVEMVNAAGSPTFYEFDSTELLELYKEMWDRDEEPVVVYHSHTAGPVEFRSYRIVDGEVTEEEVTVVDELPRTDATEE